VKRKNYKRRNRVIGISIILLLTISVIIFSKYGGGNNSEEYIEQYEPPFTKNGELLFISKNNDTIKQIDIEISDNELKREQGLMWRSKMADSIGMLFIFENEKPLSFWMKNTYFSLDILYLNESLEIVTIRKNTIPFSEESIPSDIPSKYVVEVVSDFCYLNNIEIGDKIEFKRIF